MLNLQQNTLANHPLAWTPADLRGEEIVIPLTSDEVTGVEKALQHFRGLGLYRTVKVKKRSPRDGTVTEVEVEEIDHTAVGPRTFPLSDTLRMKLNQICRDLHENRGFAILRGPRLKSNPVVNSDVEVNNNPDVSSATSTVNNDTVETNRSSEDELDMFLGMASYVGDIRGAQDRKGTMVSHITVARGWDSVPESKRHGIHTTSNLRWHTDSGIPILSLHVRGVAAEGGHTYVASAWTICRHLMDEAPAVFELLQKKVWPVQTGSTASEFIMMPLVTIQDGRIYCSVDPGRLGLHPATTQGLERGSVVCPMLSDEQHRALNLLAELATKYQFKLEVQPGDMIFINNWALLHKRDPYTDPSSGPGRHMVRLWLSHSELGWSAPPESMSTPTKAAFGESGLGHLSPELKDTKYPVSAPDEYIPPAFCAGSAAFMLDDSDVNAGEGPSETSNTSN